jgi:sec-independent protein translocase protein TatA
MSNLNVLAIHMPGFDEWIVIAVIGVIVFGKRLPEVGRNLGKGIVEFKKGLKGIEEEVGRESAEPAHPVITSLTATSPVMTSTDTQHKFDPITGAPLQPIIPPGSKFDPFTGKPLDSEQVVAATES